MKIELKFTKPNGETTSIRFTATEIRNLYQYLLESTHPKSEQTWKAFLKIERAVGDVIDDGIVYQCELINNSYKLIPKKRYWGPKPKWSKK